MKTKQTKIYQYEVIEVWGRDVGLAVGDRILDRWKPSRYWQVFNTRGKETAGWRCKLIGRASQEDEARTLRGWEEKRKAALA